MAHESQEGRPTEATVRVRFDGGQPFLRGTSLRKAVGRVLVATLLVGCACVIVAYRLRSRRSETPVQTPEELPKDAQQSAKGYIFTRSEGPNLVFTVRAQRAVDFQGGKGSTLEGVEVEIFGRQSDQHDLLTTQSCQYSSDSEDFFCAGKVEVELNAPRAAVPKQLRTSSSSAVLSARERQPIFLETSALSYNQQRAMARTAAPVKWRYGLASGSAKGLTYATRDGRIELQRDVAAEWPVKGTKRSSFPTVLKLRASGLRYAKAEQRIEMAGPVHIDEDDRHLEAQHAVVRLDAKNRLTGLLFDGGVTANDPSGDSSLAAHAASLEAELDPVSGEVRRLDASGSVQLESHGAASSITQLVADQVHVAFVGAHFHPDQGTATGNVRLTARSSRPAHPATATPAQGQGSLESEQLDANQMEFAFHPSDGTLDHANTVGAAKLILVPTSSKQGKRVVTAGQFLMAFDLGRLTDLQGLAPTRIAFEPAQTARAGTPVVESLANNLRAKLNPNTGAIESLRQSGEYQLFDGDEQANANEADYSADASTVTLTGKPTLRHPESRMAADHFSVYLATNSAEGYGHVTSTHFGPLEKSATGRSTQAPASATVPATVSPAPGEGMATRDGNSRTLPVGSGGNSRSSADTTNVLADRVTADRTKQFVHYEGHVRAWRGADVVEAPSLDIYRADRRTVADHGVLTSNLARAPLKTNTQDSGPVSSGIGASTSSTHGGKDTSVATQPVTIRADRLEYLDLGDTAAYRGHVRMDHAGATLEAERLDAYFSKATPGQPSELERAVATGSVNIVEPGRRATGDRAEYFATQGRIELSGGPPTLYDTEKGFTTGRILTFFTGSDTLQVDGGKGSRSFSRHRVSQ